MHLRSILTTAVRPGRITPTQQDALERLLPVYGVALETNIKIHPLSLFSHATHIILEIGFGMGHSFVQMAEKNPEGGYLGIELHEPGIGRVLAEIETHQLHNIRVIHGNALQVIDHHLPTASIDIVQIFFPDPWPKRKHFKRRLIQPHIVQALARILKPGGLLHVATDWEPYAHHALSTLEGCSEYSNAHGTGQFSPRPESRPVTKFETRGLRYGHDIWDIQFLRKPS